MKSKLSKTKLKQLRLKNLSKLQLKRDRFRQQSREGVTIGVGFFRPKNLNYLRV